MTRALLILIAAATGLSANPEMTAEPPGGATMDFVWIEPGTFTMGSRSSQHGGMGFPEEEPTHEVTLTRGYWLGKCEVTQGQWQAVMGTTPWSGRGRLLENPSCLAVFVNWDDCHAQRAALTAAADGAVYRLPTEAEWEYACRAGTMTEWYFGHDDTQLGAHEWTQENAQDAGMFHAQPVGLLLPNPWGLHDMGGNVSEWVQDWYGEYTADPQVDPLGPGVGPYRVVRGGCLELFWRYSRSANRFRSEPGGGAYWVGVRLVREGAGPSSAVVPGSWGGIKRRIGTR